MTPNSPPTSAVGCTAATVAPACLADGEALAPLRARAALAGFTLSVMTDADGLCLYLVSRWGMSRTLTDLAGLVAFLRRVGAIK